PLRSRLNGYLRHSGRNHPRHRGAAKVKLLPQEKKSIGQTPTGNVEAYTYYLRGRQFLHRHSKSYYQLARRMFAKSVELDPAYARAYAGIADCASFLFLHYNDPVEIKGL